MTILDTDAELSTGPTEHRFTVDEYQRMGEMDFFLDRRVELVDGRIIEMPPKKDLHTASTMAATRFMNQIFASGWTIRVQEPLHISNYSEPEPDIAIVRGGDFDFVGKGHPTSADLVIEVADTTLRYDRAKGGLYAAAAVPDYWIINLLDRQIEVYRDPTSDPAHRFGHRYAPPRIIRPGDSIAPLAAPSSPIPVAKLFP